MLVNGRHYRTIWIDERNELCVIDQTVLPHEFRIVRLHTPAEVCRAISSMVVRGAGLIGATAGYGMWLAAAQAPEDRPFTLWMAECAASLIATRPTASNLAWAVERQRNLLASLGPELRKTDAVALLRAEADRIADEDAEFCRSIGQHGGELITAISRRKSGETVHVLTHCNAGWLAFVDYGSALSPVYAAFDAGVDVHVWVDETRPRNQGASLTAWELGRHGVRHDVIADNAGGHLMQHGMVDLVITGADRVTRCGDAANKIGTYLKALAAADNNVPFYVALPSSTFDFSLCDGVRDIPIEERDGEEVRRIRGVNRAGAAEHVLLCPEFSPARNWAFDVTPGRLITGLITERGICAASEEGVLGLYPEHAGRCSA